MQLKIRQIFSRFALPFLALLVGLNAALFIVFLLGENPLNVLSILLRGAFGDRTQIGYSLYFATPLFFTGLSVAWAFRAGLFNIGAEGQMTLGGVAIAAIGICFPNLPAILAIPFSLAAAFLAGGLWGAIAGWIKAKRGCHEVLATILLNFISYGLASFLILNIFKNPLSQNPETAYIGPGYHLAVMDWLGGSSPLNYSILIALLAAIIYAFVFGKTKFGFFQRMTGGAPAVGLRAGLNVNQQIVWAMFISGGLAALAGSSQIMGYSFKTHEGFTAGAGFVGVAVALLGQNSAIGIVLAALLFGILNKGTLDLDLDTQKVTRDLAFVIQAFIVLAVASHRGLESLVAWLQQRKMKGT